MKSLKIEIAIISLAKRIDEIFIPGRKDSIIKPHTSSVLKLLQRIRDEAHRFAIEYHRKLRGKKVVSSELDEIPGIGQARKTRILIEFGSMEAVRSASFSDLITCPGISKNIAAVIYEYLHPDENSFRLERVHNDS